MSFSISEDNKLRRVIIVGDRVLLKTVQGSGKTESGLYLPPGVEEKEKVQRGYVIKTGPGYVIPTVSDEGEDWKPKDEVVRYIPLQAKEGDLAIFQLNLAKEVKYDGEKYYIVPHHPILMLEREGF